MNDQNAKQEPPIKPEDWSVLNLFLNPTMKHPQVCPECGVESVGQMHRSGIYIPGCPHDTRERRIWQLLREIENHCPCGARPESLNTHPHVSGCPVEAALTLTRITPASTPADAPKCDHTRMFDLPCGVYTCNECKEVIEVGCDNADGKCKVCKAPTTNASIPLADATGDAGEITKVHEAAFPVEVTGPGGAGTVTEYRVDIDFALEQARTIATLRAECERLTLELTEAKTDVERLLVIAYPDQERRS